MNCGDARRAIGGEPGHTSAELEEHLRQCEVCTEFLRETRMLDEKIRRALELDVEALPVRAQAPTSQAPMSSSRRWALAAGVAVALAAGVVLWAIRPSGSLAAHVVEHVDSEPTTWTATTPLPEFAGALTLRGSGVRVRLTEGDIVYADDCLFRGRFVPHLVVRTASGPVTVMILPDEHVSRIERFSEEGYSGVLLPAERGSVAVLMQGSRDVEPMARNIMQRLKWESVAG